MSAQFGIDWTGLVTTAIDEGARSDVQKVFSSLSDINFSDAKLGSYRKSASALGMSQPTTVEALMKFEYNIRPHTVSSLASLSNVK